MAEEEHSAVCFHEFKLPDIYSDEFDQNSFEQFCMQMNKTG